MAHRIDRAMARTLNAGLLGNLARLRRFGVFAALFIAALAAGYAQPLLAQPLFGQQQTAPAAPAASATQNAASPATAPATGAAQTADPAINALLQILKSDQARSELIQKLEALQGTPKAQPTSPSAAPAPSAVDQPTAAPASTPQDLGAAQPSANGAPPAGDPSELPLFWATTLSDYALGLAGQFTLGITGFWRDLTSLPSAFITLGPDKQARIALGLPALLITAIFTLLLFRYLRKWLSRLIFRSSLYERDESVPRALGLLFLAILRDVVALAIAYVVGYLASVLVFGGVAVETEQSYFFNAFLIAGAVQIGLAVLVHPGRNRLPVFNLPRHIGDELNRGLVILFAILIYGTVALVPISNYWTNLATGRTLRILFISVAAIWAIWLIHQLSKLAHLHRQEVLAERHAAQEAERASAKKPAKQAEPEIAAADVWLMLWPSIAYFYVALSWTLAIAQPALMLEIVGSATIGTLIVGASVAVLWRALTGLAKNGVRMPRRMSKALPPLEDRINGFLPYLSYTLAIFVVLTAAFFLLDAWGVVDGPAAMADPRWQSLIGRGVSAFFIVFGALFAWAIVASFIDHRLNLNLPGRNVTARSRTLMSLFRNAFTVVLLIFAGMSALSQIGIDIAPLLAGAGVAGLAIGFGAQKMVQDIITGIFIQVENAINVGDVVTVAGISGVVEKLTIRSVGVRDLNGVYHIVPFSAVDTVSNFMRKFAYHVAEIGVAYKESIPHVKQAMQDAFDRLRETEFGAFILDDLEMHGVTALADSSVVVRARIKTKPGEQWGVGRAYTEMVKQVFDERGIEIPYPHRTMVYRPDEIEQIPTPPKRRSRAKSTGTTKS